MRGEREVEGGSTIWRWPGGEPELIALLRATLDTGSCPSGERVGLADVWLVDNAVVKLQGAPSGLLRSWRRSRLRRAAAGHYSLLPLVSPRPLALIERRSPGRRLLGAALAMERLVGVELRTAWADESARDALAPVMVQLIADGAIHGDIHPGNLLWDGQRWAVIDLDSLRHPLHGLLRRRTWLRTWGSLLAKVPDEAGMAVVHAAACAMTGHGDGTARWRQIVERAEAERRRRGWPPLAEGARRSINSGGFPSPGA